MACTRFLFTGICLLVSCKPSLCQQCSDPKCKLIQNLTESYWKDTLPDCSGSGFPVDLAMQLLLRQVVELDEPRQILTTNVWLRIKWNDCRLSWNPADYNGIDMLYFPFGSIWTPDVTLYDDSAFGSNIALSERKFYMLEVNSTGQVKQKFPTLLKSVCGVDTTQFPFDKQICPLKFVPWVYDSSAVNLTTYIENRNKDIYIENAEWILNGIKTETAIAQYSGQSFTEVIYHVEIQRRPTFIMLTLFFPCILISTMAVLGFLLPPSSGQKVLLQLTLLLSLTVFQFLTLGIVPPNSKPLPVMCVYFAVVMMLASLSCLLSVLVMKIHLKGEGGWKVSPKVRNLLVGRLGRLLRVKRPHILREHAQVDLSKKQKSDDSNNLSSAQSDGQPPHPAPRRLSTLSLSLEEEGSSSDIGVIIKSFQKVAERLSKLIEHMEKEKKKHESVEFQDWVTIASIIDRLCLIVYICLSVIVFIVFISALTS